MRSFSYSRPSSIGEAIQAGQNSGASYLGGGTNLVDLMKMGVARPSTLVDIARLPMSGVEERDGVIRIGAALTNTDCANHPLIRTRFPVLSQAILSGASQQLRNKATMGGNLLQRTRCYYFYDPGLGVCNKRNPGSGCSAKQGVQRIHAILGASEQCIATHPSDMCVALAALGATVIVEGPKGRREIPFTSFHRLPGHTPEIDTNLRAGELVVAIDLPSLSYAKQCAYIKVRDRNSYAFALVSVAAIVDVDGSSGNIRKAHLALGGVAHKPWRATLAEAHLKGKKLDAATIREAAEAELHHATPYAGNKFKVELAKRTIVRAVMTAAEQG